MFFTSSGQELSFVSSRDCPRVGAPAAGRAVCVCDPALFSGPAPRLVWCRWDELASLSAQSGALQPSLWARSDARHLFC